jgi:hypothetical protein
MFVNTKSSDSFNERSFKVKPLSQFRSLDNAHLSLSIAVSPLANKETIEWGVICTRYEFRSIPFGQIFWRHHEATDSGQNV